MIVHFKGAQAHQIEIDFSKLLSSGRLDEPVIKIPGYVNQKRKKTLSYRICSVRDPNEKSEWFVVAQTQTCLCETIDENASFLLQIKN